MLKLGHNIGMNLQKHVEIWPTFSQILSKMSNFWIPVQLKRETARHSLHCGTYQKKRHLFFVQININTGLN